MNDVARSISEPLAGGRRGNKRGVMMMSAEDLPPPKAPKPRGGSGKRGRGRGR